MVKNMIKKIIAKRFSEEVIDYSKASGHEVLVRSLDNLTTQKAIGMWKKFIFEACESILQARYKTDTI